MCNRGDVFSQGAGHNDVELYSQYLDRLKQFVSVELANWQSAGIGQSDDVQLVAAPKQDQAQAEKLLWEQRSNTKDTTTTTTNPSSASLIIITFPPLSNSAYRLLKVDFGP